MFSAEDFGTAFAFEFMTFAYFLHSAMDFAQFVKDFAQKHYRGYFESNMDDMGNKFLRFAMSHNCVFCIVFRFGFGLKACSDAPAFYLSTSETQ